MIYIIVLSLVVLAFSLLKILVKIQKEPEIHLSKPVIMKSSSERLGKRVVYNFKKHGTVIKSKRGNIQIGNNKYLHVKKLHGNVYMVD